MTSPGIVTPIRTATNTTVTAIKIRYYSGNWHMPVVITPDGKTAYVTSALGVVPIRTATNTALKAVKVGGLPAYIRSQAVSLHSVAEAVGHSQAAALTGRLADSGVRLVYCRPELVCDEELISALVRLIRTG